jgi:hypothetical protein
MRKEDEPRPRKVSDAQIAEVSRRLTERDRQIALDCYEHQVLTTEQLQRLYFPSIRSARYRLLALYSLRVIDRFRPTWRRGEGSTPFHWILDEAGAYVVAAEQRIDRRELRWRHATALAAASSSTLTHRIEANEFFTRLSEDAGAAGGNLSEWYGERTTHKMLDGIVKPDGYGVLALPRRAPIHLLLELDRNTEPAERLNDKAIRYARVIPRSPFRDLNPLVLFVVPSTPRAATADAAIKGHAVTLATAVWTRSSVAAPLPAIIAALGSRDESHRLPPYGCQPTPNCGL